MTSSCQASQKWEHEGWGGDSYHVPRGFRRLLLLSASRCFSRTVPSSTSSSSSSMAASCVSVSGQSEAGSLDLVVMSLLILLGSLRGAGGSWLLSRLVESLAATRVVSPYSSSSISSARERAGGRSAVGGVGGPEGGPGGGGGGGCIMGRWGGWPLEGWAGRCGGWGGLWRSA